MFELCYERRCWLIKDEAGTTLRLKSEFWVKSHIRVCNVNGVAAVVVRRGDSDAGAIFVKVVAPPAALTCLYGPAPAGMDSSQFDRHWVEIFGADPVDEAKADGYLRRQADFDPDLWVLEIEDRDGRHFLGDALVKENEISL